MIIDDNDKGLGFLIAETARLHRKLLDRRLQPFGLTRAQWAVLAVLVRRDGRTQSEIAEELEIEKPTAGRLLDHLEQLAWIERRPTPADRRVWRVHIPTAARPRIAAVADVVRDTRHVMVQGLSADQQHLLVRQLGAIKTNMVAALGEAAGDPG
ncbi:MarR family transcriptional regulator [Rhodoplanes serenus]|uniref:MarR family transcriptional regulator n=1 Tax=Rhodoplanes serenus TaxID=200615 RepID=A0A9X4XM91_9BRAD|nr:MarR family transcriptional regulator [Rhodoplanes serenus]MTW17242.1 MarR family transcriptional regulator [Rhodoplanes serenus]